MTARDGSNIDRLIHQPARLVIVAQLAVVDEADFVFLQNRTGLTPGNMSAHLAKLIDADYVSAEKSFADNRPRTTYRLTVTGHYAFDEYQRTMRSMLDGAGN